VGGAVAAAGDGAVAPVALADPLRARAARQGVLPGLDEVPGDDPQALPDRAGAAGELPDPLAGRGEEDGDAAGRGTESLRRARSCLSFSPSSRRRSSTQSPCAFWVQGPISPSGSLASSRSFS
jgi:hypothetical protein